MFVVRRLILALAAVALTLAVYSALAVRNIPLINVCGGGGCQELLKGRWSQCLGIPVSIWGVVVYGAIVVLAAWNCRQPLPSAARRLFLMLTICAGGAAIWFVALQLLVLRSVCAVCMAAHATALLLAVAVGWAARRERTSTRPALGWANGGAPLALLLVGLLAFSQIFMPPKGFAVAALPETEASDSPDLGWLLQAAAHGGVAPEGPLPLLGSPDAPHVAIFFHQYTCSFCRRMHNHLREAVARYGDQLAVLVLPYVPELSAAATQPQCAADFELAEYARLALAVWRLRKDGFATFEDYLRTTPPPMLANAKFPNIISLYQARRRAATIVTEQALEDALQAPAIDDILTKLARAKQSLNPKTNEYRPDGALVPLTCLGESVIVGELDSASLNHQIETIFKISPVERQARARF